MVLIFYAASKACYGSAGPTEQLLKPGEPKLVAEQETGTYNTTVIQGETISQLNAWLTENGFSAFAGDQARVAESYMARKWVFLCARLKPTASGSTGVRPLTVRFAIEHAVYPMSLTKGAGTVPVDLYVVGHERMDDPLGRLRRVVDEDTFFRSGRRRGSNLGEALYALRQAQTKSETVNPQTSGFPANLKGEVPFIPPGRSVLLDELMAHPEAGISHLSGVFTPAGDWADIHLAPTEIEAARVHYRTRKAWMLEGVQSIGGGLAIAAFLMMALFAMTIGPVGKRPGWQWWAAACLVALGVWALGLYDGALNTVFIEESQLANADPGSPESFTGLLDTWVRSLTSPP